jgi:hypothetical protein
VLDHNFPQPIVLPIIQRSVVGLTLQPLKVVNPKLIASFEDWQVILALSQLGFQGFVTCDDDMLWLPEVIAVIEDGDVRRCMRVRWS